MSALSVIDKINAMKSNKSGLDESRQLFSDCMAIFVAEGWSANELAEYRAFVAQLMRSGSDDEKQAAREFWTERGGGNSALGINARIREANATVKERIAA